MNQWYELTAGLDTVEPVLDEVSQERVLRAARKKLPKGRRWKLAAVVAAILLLTACGVATATYVRWFENMANDPFAPDESENVLASMGTAIGQSQTVDGLSVTLHGALWDGRVLLLSLSAKGEAVPENHFGVMEADGSWLSWSKAQAERVLLDHGRVSKDEIQAYLADYEAIMADVGRITLKSTEDAGAREIQLAVTGEMGSEDLETELTLYLKDLWGAGPFQFDFTVAQNRSQLVYTGEARAELENGTPCTVTKVLLTPLRVEVTIHGEREMGAAQRLEIEGLQTDQRVFTSRKGHTMQDNGDGSWDAVFTYGPLERVIDPSQVTGIYLGDYLLELDALILEE